jgi:hypothetical protein
LRNPFCGSRNIVDQLIRDRVRERGSATYNHIVAAISALNRLLLASCSPLALGQADYRRSFSDGACLPQSDAANRRRFGQTWRFIAVTIHRLHGTLVAPVADARRLPFAAGYEMSPEPRMSCLF